MDHKFEVTGATATTIDRKKVDIPFRGAEKRMFERYLDSKGLKAGPWLRVKILEAIKYAEAAHE